MRQIIRSIQNPKIKFTAALLRSKNRKKYQTSLIEGDKEIRRFLASDLENIYPTGIFLCEDFLSPQLEKEIENHPKLKHIPTFFIAPEVFSKLTYRQNSGGVVIEFEYASRSIDDLKKEDTKRVVILDGVEKPGNIGAIMRTAVATGFQSLILCNYDGDIYNPNIIRASLGGVFNLKTFTTTTEQAIKVLKKFQIFPYAGTLSGKKGLYEISFGKQTALVFGSEEKGINEAWEDFEGLETFLIPQNQEIDSLNVSVSFAVTAYELYRQKILSQ